jgi:hypothetical protein
MRGPLPSACWTGRSLARTVSPSAAEGPSDCTITTSVAIAVGCRRDAGSFVMSSHFLGAYQGIPATIKTGVSNNPEFARQREAETGQRRVVPRWPVYLALLAVAQYMRSFGNFGRVRSLASLSPPARKVSARPQLPDNEHIAANRRRVPGSERPRGRQLLTHCGSRPGRAACAS